MSINVKSYRLRNFAATVTVTVFLSTWPFNLLVLSKGDRRKDRKVNGTEMTEKILCHCPRDEGCVKVKKMQKQPNRGRKKIPVLIMRHPFFLKKTLCLLYNLLIEQPNRTQWPKHQGSYYLITLHAPLLPLHSSFLPLPSSHPTISSSS